MLRMTSSTMVLALCELYQTDKPVALSLDFDSHSSSMLALNILFIGYSRVLEGSHWLDDALAGYLAGALWRAR